jgi:disease resistance protein RPM1
VFGSLDQLGFNSFKTGILQVLDLEGCRGFKANHGSVTDICEMTLLKYLSLRRTNISKLPQKIGNLKHLETLDIRQTDVKELPKSIVQLERISNILGGDKRTRKTLKLPKDVKGTMKGLRILSGIEIVKGSTAALDLRDFTRLRKLAIYKLNKGDQNQMFEDLCSSIVYLSGYSLQSLAIDDESSEFFEMLDSMTSHPADLRTLKLSGKLLKIPQWLPSLNELVKLTLSVTALRTDNLVLISQLQSLFSLTFSISATNQDPDIAGILEENKADSGGEIFLPSKGFGKLKLLCIVVPLLPALNFSKNGTPLLEKVELRFKRFQGLRGIDKVVSLRDVLITVDDKPDKSTKIILEDLRNSSSEKHVEQYTLTVKEYQGE